jgi:branched-chain amino acid transport system permease protein
VANVSLDGAIQITLAGLATGSVYALLLLGILMVFRVSRAVNFAQGQLGMIAAYVAYALFATAMLPIWLAIVIGLALAAVLSFLTDRIFIERLAKRGALGGQDLVVTLGIMLLLTAAAETFLGTQTKSFTPLGNDVQFGFRSVSVNANQILVLVVTILILVGFAIFLRTRPGVAMRASAMNPDLARSFGVNVHRVKAITWTVSGLLAGLVGVVIASRLSVDPYYMTPFLISAFVAGIIGGLDRFTIPILIAFGLALYQNWSAYIFGSTAGTASLFILVIVLLAILPKRFLDERREARA